MKFFVLPTIALLLLCASLPADELPPQARAFLESRCIDCHDSEVKKGGLDLSALSTRLDDPPTEAKWTLIFDRVERGEMPPRDEVPPPAVDRDAFLNSLGGFLSEHDAARHAQTGRVAWRRLNRVEYENTLHDLLAIDIPLAVLLPEDGSAAGFDNVSAGLRLSATQIESYLTAAEKALDAALNFGPRPPFKKQRLSYLDLPQIKEQLAKPTGSLNKDGSRYQQNYRALPDALVIFPNETFGGTLLRDARADVAGLYRIRLSAYGYQSSGQPTVVARLMVTNFARNRLGAAFDLPVDKPRVAEVTLRMDEGELLYMSALGCDFAADGTHVQDVGAEKYTGSGMAVQWLEMEGPLLESWPPASLQRIFDDLPIKALEKPQGNRAYQVVAEHPAEDIEKVVARFAARAFRRPAGPDDTARYVRLARQALAEGASFESALRRACKAILVAPEFIFLREPAGKLDDYALAARLSYFLWSSMPDEELLSLAAQGTLHDPAVLRAQTERLLASPRAAAFTQNFCGQWLNLRAIKATMPDRQLYPEFDDLLEDAMVRESESFFDELLRSDLPLANLVDSNFAMLNRRLAEHYEISGVDNEVIRKVPVTPASHRGGLLTQASVLKVTANGTLSSPVVRGSWVMKRILGRTPEPPPADAGAIEPDTRGATTIRDQLAKHRRSETCAGCHQYMDPLGFALESYDVIGGWRESYRTTQGQGPVAVDPLTKRNREYRQGLPVDPSGELADGRSFRNIDELKRLLLDQQPAIAANVVNNLIAYATGAGVTFADRAATQAILQRAQPSGYGLRTLVHEVVQSSLFQTK